MRTEVAFIEDGLNWTEDSEYEYKQLAENSWSSWFKTRVDILEGTDHTPITKANTWNEPNIKLLFRTVPENELNTTSRLPEHCLNIAECYSTLP